MEKVIFLTNDDGYFSQGLIAMRDSLAKIARVVVVAPANEKSACGHGLCVSKPLQLTELQTDFYKLDDGSPTDCVYVGLRELFSTKKPDLIISGINIGANLGEDTTYSGTVAGAMEGALHEIPSIAISQVIHDKHGEDNKTAKRDFTLALEVITQLALDVLHGRYTIAHRKFLNVNIPQIAYKDYKGMRVTQLGHRIFASNVQQIESPRNQIYYWIGYNPMQWRERDNSDNLYFQNSPHWQSCDESCEEKIEQNEYVISDFEAVTRGYASLTPMQLDMTSYGDMQSLLDYCTSQK